MAKREGRTPLYEQMVKMIKDQIVSGVYTKGDLLPSEKELIDSFGVSRITVRKAMSVLAEMGYIKTEKGRGSEVILDVEDMLAHNKYSEEIKEYYRIFMESTQIRLMLEPEIAKQVALNATDEQLASLRIWENQIRAKSPTYEFHLAIIKMLNNKELNKILMELIYIEETKEPNGIIPREQQKKVSEIMSSQHQKILRAIEERNGEFAYFYMKEHMEYVEQIYKNYFARMEF